MSTYVTHTTDADSTREFGARLAPLLQAGDLVMLSGELGAGKTTLAQGIGSALNVRGRVSSPTFIVARVHPSLVGGPDLVHVDAYRLTSLEDLETLDLDSSLEESITLVEWGEGMVEGISDNRLEIKVERPQGDWQVPMLAASLTWAASTTAPAPSPLPATVRAGKKRSTSSKP